MHSASLIFFTTGLLAVSKVFFYLLGSFYCLHKVFDIELFSFTMGKDKLNFIFIIYSI